jgi:hypothetical protein
MLPGRTVQFPASVCDVCPQPVPCIIATLEYGRTLTSRAAEQFQKKLHDKLRTKCGQAALRKRTAVEHAITHQLVHQGR